MIFLDTFSMQFGRRHELLLCGKTIEFQENIFWQNFTKMDFYLNKFNSQVFIQYSNSRRARLRPLGSSGLSTVPRGNSDVLHTGRCHCCAVEDANSGVSASERGQVVLVRHAARMLLTEPLAVATGNRVWVGDQFAVRIVVGHAYGLAGNWNERKVTCGPRA